MKNKILLAITYIAGILFILGGLSLDSDTYIPAVICAVSGSWLLLMLAANKERIERYE